MRMDTDEFEKSVNKAFDALPTTSGEEAEAMKFQTLQLEVLKLQAEVGESFNLTGDDGYVGGHFIFRFFGRLSTRFCRFIKLQIAMMEHQTDDQMRYTASMAYHKAFTKLKLSIPGAS